MTNVVVELLPDNKISCLVWSPYRCWLLWDLWTLVNQLHSLSMDCTRGQTTKKQGCGIWTMVTESVIHLLPLAETCTNVLLNLSTLEVCQKEGWLYCRNKLPNQPVESEWEC